MTNREAIEILKERIELSNEMLTKPFFQDAQETIRKTIETYKVAIEALSLPSAHPEIVRCKDCIHRPTLDTVLDMDMYVRGIVEFPDEVCPCQCDISLYSWYPDDDFYCGHAERRQDE